MQIGITLIGILAGAYSGASLGGPVGAAAGAARPRAGDGARRSASPSSSSLTTYASLVIGELVPKQFALRSPEPIAAVMALPMLWLARATAPLVWLLDRTSALIFRLLRLHREIADQVTAEELHLVVAEAAPAGVLEESERAIISGVVRLADRPTREVMTPRTEVDWIDADADAETIRRALLETPAQPDAGRRRLGRQADRRRPGPRHRRRLIEGRPLDLRALMRAAPVVPDQMDAMDALDRASRREVPMVFVHDEYGHFEGLVTPADLLTALAGEFRVGPISTPIRLWSSATTAAGGCPARSRPTPCRTGSASACPTTATMRPRPASPCRC